jgi:hypothetical protein
MRVVATFFFLALVALARGYDKNKSFPFSFVVSARNDDYNGGFMHRFKARTN